MTEDQIKDHKLNIDQMSQYQMASLKRFAPSGHPYFDSTLPLNEYFEERFKELGGMTPEISKELGWR